MNDIEKTIEDALHKFFAVKNDDGVKRFIDTNRIPLICEDVSHIKNNINTLHAKMVEHYMEDEKHRIEDDKKWTEIKTKLDPIHKTFESVSGFGGVSKILLKVVIMIGAGIGSLYAIIEFFKRVGK